MNRRMTSTAFLALLCACSSSPNERRDDGNEMYRPARVIPYVVNVDAPMARLSPEFTSHDIRAASNLVADWQIRHMDAFHASNLANFQGLRRYSFGGWLMGTMAIGMTRWGTIDGNERYLEFIRREADAYGWAVESRVFDADDYVIGQTYLELYDLGNRADLAPLLQRLDYIYENWPTVNRESGTACRTLERKCRERWSWSDALFMGAPVFVHAAATTGDERYLEFGNHEFWASFDTLWDPDERLLFRDRRYISMRDADGHKLFWSRGNGWVFASFARLLPKLPDDHVDRGRYVERFCAMAERLTELQRNDGSWTSSLTNPALSPSPENSGSAFFTFGIAWGINAGLLDRDRYLPAAKKAWSNLVANIYADGRLAFVQPSGSAPQTVHKESTDVYGVGAFLLAASEIYKLAGKVPDFSCKRYAQHC